MIRTSSDKRRAVVLRIPGTDPTAPGLILHAHLDVVPAVASEWTRGPFEGIVESVDVSAGAQVNRDSVLARVRSSELARMRADVRRLEAKQGETALLRFNATGSLTPGDKLVGAAKGMLEVPDAGALSRQPALAAGGFTRGSVSASFDAKLDGAGQVTATVTTRNLTSRQAPTAPLNLDSTFTAVLKTDGSGTIKLPLTLTAGPRKTDVTIDGSFTQPAGGYAFTGRISSSQANVDDLMMLTGLVPATGTPTPAPASGGRPAAPASGPFWKGMTGRIEADLKNVQSGTYVLSGLRGTLQVTDNRIAVSGLEGTFRNNNPFKLSANLNYQAAQARPYVLDGNLDVTGLDVGEILRQANPNERPALETKVNVTGRIAATAAQPDGLLENLTGQFDATGSAGCYPSGTRSDCRGAEQRRPHALHAGTTLRLRAQVMMAKLASDNQATMPSSATSASRALPVSGL